MSSHYHESLSQQRNIKGIKFFRFKMPENGDIPYEVYRGIDKGGYAVKAAINAGLHKNVCKRLT